MLVLGERMVANDGEDSWFTAQDRPDDQSVLSMREPTGNEVGLSAVKRTERIGERDLADLHAALRVCLFERPHDRRDLGCGGIGEQAESNRAGDTVGSAP